jgi:NitT/TauT family transport system substrate-binding protein
MAGCGRTGNRFVRLGIGAQQSPSQLLIYLARELRFFEACGASIEEFPGSGRAMEALVGGSLDVLSGYHEQTLQLPEGAPPMQSFVAMTNGHLVALAVSPARPGITSLAQLSRRNIGVTTLGSATHMWLTHLVRTRQNEMAGINPIAISTAVRTLKQRHGDLRVLADTHEAAGARAFYGVDQYPGTVLFARRDWIAGHAAEVRGLTCAVKKARVWALVHPPADMAAQLPFVKAADAGAVALYTEVIRATVAMLTPDGRITAEGAEAARRLAGTTPRSAEASYTNDFID